MMIDLAWLTIKIWDLQASYNIVVQFGFLGPRQSLP